MYGGASDTATMQHTFQASPERHPSMKYVAAVFILALSFSTAYAQHGLPQGAEETLSRLEQFFNTGDTRNFQMHLPSGIRMRVEDSVYALITDVYIVDVLQRYLAGKDSLEFKFSGALADEVDSRHTSGILTDIRYANGEVKEAVYVGTGKLYYTSAGSREKAYITVWLAGGGLSALDISKKPRGAVFFTSPYN